jgi:hypothetical protein
MLRFTPDVAEREAALVFAADPSRHPVALVATSFAEP